MNDFEAPKLRDTDPPRLFNTVTSANVTYNMDFVGYLMTTEIDRRRERGLPQLTQAQATAFHQALTNLVIIQANPEAAIRLRPTDVAALKIEQLNG